MHYQEVVIGTFMAVVVGHIVARTWRRLYIRWVLDCQLDLLGLNTGTVYYTSQLNTAAATLLASPAITY
jgi:hypothetical protein